MFVPDITDIGTNMIITYCRSRKYVGCFKFVVRACLLCELCNYYTYVTNYEKSYGLLN